MKDVTAARVAASLVPRTVPTRTLAKRLVTILAVCSTHVIRCCVPRLRQHGAGRALGGELADLFERLGPAFIKIGQILSSRPDLLPPHVAVPLARLQQDVSPAPLANAREFAEAALGRRLDDVFRSFECAPIASGSIANVYRAVLADGTCVAVKVRRPGVVETIATDVRLLEALAAVFDRLPWTAAIPFKELVAQLAAPLLEQVDFRLEAANHRAFQRNFRDVERIAIPRLIEPLCTDGVLTMEYVPDLRRLSPSELQPEEGRTAAQTGLRALYKMIFLDGLVHADLHQANVFASRNGGVVLLDMGLVARLPAADRRRFAAFFIGLVTNNASMCSQILVDMSAWLSPWFDRRRFDADIKHLVARYCALPSRDFEVARFVLELMDIQRRSGVRGSTAFIMTVLSMVVFDGICKQLYPDCDFQSEARGYLAVAAFAHDGRRSAEGADEARSANSAVSMA